MNKMKSVQRLAMLEAALYSAGRPIDMDGLKLVVRTRSEKVVQGLIRELALRYEARRSALEIRILPSNRAVMRLREKYDRSVKRLTTRPLLSIGPLKTLSYIAYHQPVLQRKVVEDRGNHVYYHLRQMEEMGLITRERLDGRGYIIETTSYFSDYFGFGLDPSKSKIQLRQMFNQMTIHKLDNGNEESAPSEALELAFAEGPLADSGDRLP
ncbi:MAG: SMC-Scp complex subunit ScpB [Candidatus Bathyarchaeota archaeon]|nr:MAG: SMC-Scp complex subunit ScpB [Candidatus Bathyarchaeota archaeon]